MIIFKIYRTVFDTGNSANLTNPAIEPLDDYSIEIKDSRERVVVSTISPENDTHALFVPLSGQDVKCDCQQQGNMVILNPHFRYMDETSSIEVDIKNTDKRFTLLPYHAEFAFYGYDLELDIVLVDNDHAKYPFNHCKVYRKPFGSQVNVLNTVSSSVAERVYNITTESNSSTVAQSIKSTQNFAIYSNALEHNLSVTGSSSKFVKTGCKQNPVAANPDSTLITDSLGKIEAGKWLPEIELILKNYSLGGIYGKKCIYMELDFRGVISEKTKGEPHYLCENAGIVLSYVNANSALLQTKYFLRRFSSVEFTGKQMILIDSLPFSDTIAKEVRVEFLLFGREAPRITPPYYDGSAQVTGNHIVYQNRTYHTGEIVNFDKNSVIQYENNGSLQPVIWTECNKWYRHPVTNEIFLGIIHTKSIEITPQLRIVKTLEIKD
jgi:hypothetical protein